MNERRTRSYRVAEWRTNWLEIPGLIGAAQTGRAPASAPGRLWSELAPLVDGRVLVVIARTGPQSAMLHSVEALQETLRLTAEIERTPDDVLSSLPDEVIGRDAGVLCATVDPEKGWVSLASVGDGTIAWHCSATSTTSLYSSTAPYEKPWFFPIDFRLEAGEHLVLAATDPLWVDMLNREMGVTASDPTGSREGLEWHLDELCKQCPTGDVVAGIVSFTPAET